MLTKNIYEKEYSTTEIKVVVPKKVIHQMNYICSLIPKNEWSGVLFYKIEGSIKEPEKMSCILEDIFLMDKGSHVATNYEFTKDVFKHMEENNLEDCLWGQIHSHCDFSTFFSITDISELEDNLENYNFYLSFITNNNNDYKAKLCFLAESNQNFNVNYQARDENGNLYTFTKEEKLQNCKKMIIFDCNIQPEEIVTKVSESFKDRVSQIINKASAITPKYSAVQNQNYNGYNGYNNYGSNYNKSAINNVKNKNYNTDNYKNKLPKKAKTYPEIDYYTKSLIDRKISDFAIDLLGYNEGATEYFTSVDDFIRYVSNMGVTGVEIAQDVMENFVDAYSMYFEELDSAEQMSYCISQLIREYEDSLDISNIPNADFYLSPVINSLKTFLNNFDNERR